jgi:formaldehyde-activating enzyme
MTAFTSPKPGHSPILVCVGETKDDYEPVWPPTVMMNKATTTPGSSHETITFGAAQLGIGQGVLDAVAEGLLEPTGDTIVFVAIWVHEDVEDETAMRKATRAATHKGVATAVQGRDPAAARALVERRDSLRSPFRRGERTRLFPVPGTARVRYPPLIAAITSTREPAAMAVSRPACSRSTKTLMCGRSVGPGSTSRSRIPGQRCSSRSKASFTVDASTSTCRGRSSNRVGSVMGRYSSAIRWLVPWDAWLLGAGWVFQTRTRRRLDEACSRAIVALGRRTIQGAARQSNISTTAT